MKILKIIVLFASTLFPLMANSNSVEKKSISIEGCKDKVLAKVIDDLNIRKNLSVDYLGACKVMPNAPELTIIALLSSENSAYFEDLDLVIVKSNTGEMINKLHTPHFYETGPHAYIDGGLTIDTAKYQLTKDIRAFGITYTDDHTFEGNQKVLHLYYAKEKEIVPVLGGGDSLDESGLSIETFWQHDGCTKSTLSMLPSITNNFFDILVTEKSSSNCDFKKSSTRTRKYILKYDNKQYDNKTGQYSENQPNQN